MTESARSIADALTAIEDDADDYLGPVGLRMLRRVRSSLSLTRARSVEDLTTVAVLVDVAGRHDTFLAVAESLLGVPWTGNYDTYDSIRQIFAGAVRRCHLLDRDPEPFSTMVLLPEGGKMRSELKSRSAGSLYKHMQRTRDQTEPGTYGMSVAAMNIKELYLAWALGGSMRFSRTKIDNHIDGATTRLRELRAIR